MAGKKIHLKATAYGTDCYPNRLVEKEITLKSVQSAVLCNPRNCYQNYNCAVNLTDKTIYTYMGVIKPNLGNANYCSAGQLSPLFNDPYFKTIGLGTRIFLGGGIGYVTGPGTQHNPNVKRTPAGIPIRPAGTIWTMGDLTKMSPDWLVGISILGYGCSLSVGLGIPIPILNEEMAQYTAVSDEDLFTQVIDYGNDYPNGVSKSITQVSYADLKRGFIKIQNKTVKTVPLSSVVKAREVAEILKKWILSGKFLLGEPQFTLPDGC